MRDNLFGQRKIPVVSVGKSILFFFFPFFYLKEIKQKFEFFKESDVLSSRNSFLLILFNAF